MSSTLVGNDGKGHSHVCGRGHSLWDPTRWRTGEPCPLFVGGDGRRRACPGILEPVGAGSRAEIKTTKEHTTA